MRLPLVFVASKLHAQQWYSQRPHTNAAFLCVYLFHIEQWTTSTIHLYLSGILVPCSCFYRRVSDNRTSLVLYIWGLYKKGYALSSWQNCFKMVCIVEASEHTWMILNKILIVQKETRDSLSFCTRTFGSVHQNDKRGGTYISSIARNFCTSIKFFFKFV